MLTELKMYSTPLNEVGALEDITLTPRAFSAVTEGVSALGI